MCKHEQSPRFYATLKPRQFAAATGAARTLKK